MLRSLTIGRAGSDGLCLGVDGVERNLGILRPKRNETPSHDGQFTFPRVWAEPHDRLKRLRGYVVGRRKVRVVKHVRIVRLHPLCDALLVRKSAVSAAHLGSPCIQRTCDLACLTTK
jgi:hypothetical protein